MTSGERYFFHRMKLRHLQMLINLADLQSVGKVAQAMHITQPAVSKAIGDLEAGLGIALFERYGRRIKPTAVGERMIEQARGLLLHAKRVSDDVQAMAAGVGGRLELGMLSVAASSLIPHAITAFKRVSPHVTVGLHEGTLDHLIPDLRSGRLDLLVGRLPGVPIGPDLDSLPLLDDPVVVAASHDHPLARRRSLGWAALEGAAWIVPPSEAPLHDRLMATLEEHGVSRPNDVIESVSVAANLALLRAGARLELLPASLAREYARQGFIKILRLPLSGLMGPVSVIWRKQEQGNAVLDTFKACLGEAAQAIRART